MLTGTRKKLSKKAVGILHGFRSGLEEAVSSFLKKKKVEYEYETLKIPYTVPASNHTYTPDFLIKRNGVIVETKGRFTTEDRKKHLLIKEQHPNLNIRFVFSNVNAKLSKRSKTTYAKWCEKHGFLYADKQIPEEWLKE